MAGKPAPDRPALGVSALVWHDGRVLLVRRGRPPLKDMWSLPGGHVEFGESLRDAVVREVREETSIEIGGLRQIEVVEIMGRTGPEAPASHHVLIVFSGEARSGRPVAGDDAAEARFVAPREFDGLPMTDDTRRLLGRVPE